MTKRYRIIDLSHQLFHNMPSYPTLPSFKIDHLKIAARDGFTVSKITSMHTHLGTHIDLPLHIIPGSKSLDDYGLEDLSGEGAVIDLTYKKEGEEITERDLIEYGSYVKKGEMLFVYTGWSKKRSLTPTYLFKWPHLGEDAARFLVRKRIRLLGMDGLSVGGWSGRVATQGPIAKTSSLRIHEVLLEAGILLLEEVANLDKVLMGEKVARSFFIVAPLPIRGAEASPCRVLSIAPGL